MKKKTLPVRAALGGNHRLIAVCFTLGLLAMPVPLFAALGGDTDSVRADQIHMQGSVRSTQAQTYAVHEIQAATGTTVREYLSPSGIVFAVAWEGPWPPDMRQLLGNYFEEYAQAAEAQSQVRRGRTPVHVERPGLVVHFGGHPRSFRGIAYLPDGLPQGVRAEDLR